MVLTLSPSRRVASAMSRLDCDISRFVKASARPTLFHSYKYALSVPFNLVLPEVFKRP